MEAPRLARHVAALLAFLCLAAPAAAAVHVVELDGVVHAVSADHVVSAIAEAEAAKAPLVVLRIDTPGGLETAMRQIVDKLLNSRVPVVAFIGPAGARADSAGFVIAIASDLVAMAPGTSLGAAHPVSAMGGSVDETMSKKMTSAVAAYVRGKAERRGRNVELAEKAVVESRSFTEREAIEGRLADLVAADVPALLKAIEGREVRRFDGTTTTLRLEGEAVQVVTMSWRRAILSAIARPEVLFLLLLGALAGIGAEISHPGGLFPGILGALCLILLLFASQILPINWSGVLLIALGVILFAAEVKVTSYGLLTAGGLVSVVLGALMLVDSPLPELRVAWSTLLPGALLLAAWTILLVRMVVAAQRRKPTTGESGLVGRAAVAIEPLVPEGFVSIQGERWRARAEAPVAAGETVEVRAVDGLTLHVVKKGA